MSPSKSKKAKYSKAEATAGPAGPFSVAKSEEQLKGKSGGQVKLKRSKPETPSGSISEQSKKQVKLKSEHQVKAKRSNPEAPAAPAGPISVAKLLEQRRRSRAAKLLPKGGQNTNLLDVVPQVNLDPILPPTWPRVDKKFSPACPYVRSLVHGYKMLGAFFKDNYSGPTTARRQGQGFFLAKYTDQYPRVYARKPHLRHISSDQRYPEELRKGGKLTLPQPKKMSFEDLPDSDDEEDARQPKVKEDDEKEEEEKEVNDDPDEEMDMYTDYWKSHFEDDEDDERDDEDDPAY